MRVKNSFYNMIGNVAVLLIQTFLTFFVRIIFVKFLSEQYLGIQGLFINIITMLSLADLGIGTAISYILYKPLANNNTKKINIIIGFLKKIYFTIGIIILISGVLICPFLKYLVTGYTGTNMIMIFAIYFITLALEYFFIYPEILITADQKKYKISPIYISSSIIASIMQIIVLIFTKSFIVYVLVEAIIKIIRFILINIYVKKEYSNIDFNCKEKLSKKERKSFFENIKALFYLKVGDYLINGTDNILISKLINISMVGIYNNYLSIITIFKNIMVMALHGVTASYGNLLVSDEKESQKNVFNIINFITFCFVGFVFLCLMFIFNDFILFAFGKKYLLSDVIVLIICINFFISSMLIPVDMVKNAAGIYSKDKYASLIQATLNLVLSILLSYKLGLLGILLGSTISYILVTTWERPYIVFKEVFKDKVKIYYKNYIKNVIILIMTYCFLKYILGYILIKNIIISILIKGIIIAIVYSMIMIVIYRKTSEFKYVIDLVKKGVKR